VPGGNKEHRGVVGHAAGVAQQLFDGDLVAVGQDPQQPPLHRVLQRQPPLGDQLKHHGGHQRLGQAAGPVVQVGSHRPAGAQVGHAAGGLLDATFVADKGGGAGRPGGHDLLQQLLQLDGVDLPRRAHGAAVVAGGAGLPSIGGEGMTAMTGTIPTASRLKLVTCGYGAPGRTRTCTLRIRSRPTTV